MCFYVEIRFVPFDYFVVRVVLKPTLDTPFYEIAFGIVAEPTIMDLLRNHRVDYSKK